MTFAITADFVQSLQQQAKTNRQRRLLVLSGSRGWCQKLAESIHRILCEGGELHWEKVLYIGQGEAIHMPTLPAKQAGQWLGRELTFLVYDAHCGFDVDALGAISGTLCAGGLMLLLMPELAHCSQWTDPEHKRIQVYPQSLESVTGNYLQRLARIIHHSDGVTLCTEAGVLKPDVWPDAADISLTHGLSPCCTEQQAEAVAAIHKVLRGHRRRPLVLTADRGRGKSAALGIAAGQLLNEGVQRILVTAPARKNAEVLFHHAQAVFTSEHLEEHLRFIAPDELVRSQPEAELLLVDEAAAIPTPLLESLLNNYSRIVFASTIHGYEGTGRGFAIRFRQVLEQKTPAWRLLHMDQPIRWQAEDPLEAFVFEALLLNAKPASMRELPVVGADQYDFRQLSSKELLENEALLHELFGLLVLAHYQTRPLDLRQLLDGGNIRRFGLFLQGHPVATILAASEGKIESDLMDLIWLGQRRVRGHLLPQSLSNHLGLKEAVSQKGLRVIRIAVHPDRQRQGLGQQLLSRVHQWAINQRYDYLGTVFGASDNLLDFWHSAGFLPVRMGATRDGASGTHSVMMLQGLTEAGRRLQEQAQDHFRESFHWLLMDGLEDLKYGLVVRLLRQSGVASVYQTDSYRVDLLSYTQGQRQYQCCIAAIKTFAFQSLMTSRLSHQQQQLLVMKVLQNKSWGEVVRTLRLTGRKQAEALLRKILSESS